MKKVVLFVVVMFLLSSFTLAGTTSIGGGGMFPNIKVTFISQNPDPVSPGEIIIVKFKIENEGTETTDDAIAKILPEFPFSIYGDKAEKNIGKIKATSTGRDAIVVEFKLKVDESAVESNAELKFAIQLGDGQVVYDKDDFTIDLQTRDPLLEITSITTVPENVAPGSSSELRISVKNLADSTLKDIKFSLDFSDNTFPLAPYQSTSQRRIQQIKSGSQVPLTFRIIANPAATPGLYKIPLNISYNNDRGESFEIEDVIAILVGDSPELKTYIKKSSVLQAGEAGKITIELANSGTNDLKFMELTALPSKDYTLVSTSPYVYIGDVDSDDTESEEFDIYIEKKVEVLNFPVQLKYTDANNKEFSQEVNLQMNLYSSSTLKKYGVIENGNGITYVIILIVIGAGIYFYRRNKKKKR